MLAAVTDPLTPGDQLISSFLPTLEKEEKKTVKPRFIWCKLTGQSRANCCCRLRKKVKFNNDGSPFHGRKQRKRE